MSASLRRVHPEQLATIVDLLPVVLSLRDICAITGLHLDAVRREAAPFLAIMKLQGTHPQCGCGRDRFHPYGCRDSHANINRGDRLPGKTMAETGIFLARRAEAVSMLERGDRQCDVDAALGMKRGGAKNYLRYLTPAQLGQRDRLMRERGYSHAADIAARPSPTLPRVVPDQAHQITKEGSIQ